MEVAQPTLAEQLAVPLVMLLCTSVLTLIGYLLSRQMSAIDKRDDQNAEDLDELKEDVDELKIKMATVRQVLGLRDRPSDSVLKKGDSSA